MISNQLCHKHMQCDDYYLFLNLCPAYDAALPYSYLNLELKILTYQVSLAPAVSWYQVLYNDMSPNDSYLQDKIEKTTKKEDSISMRSICFKCISIEMAKGDGVRHSYQTYLGSSKTWNLCPRTPSPLNIAGNRHPSGTRSSGIMVFEDSLSSPMTNLPT